jgi:hypothetical protein
MTENGDQEATDPQDPAAPAGDSEPAVPPPAQQPAIISAHTFIHRWTTASDPAALKCDDGHTYVVKARHNGRPDISRMMIADHVVGRLGRLTGAPVPDVALVDVPAALIAAQPEIASYAPGVAHGSRYIDNTTEREGLSHSSEPLNRQRFARLSVLFGWTSGSDQQFIYEKAARPRVYSHDHGHFLGGPNWSAASLAGSHNAVLDQSLVHGCNLTAAEIAEAMTRLQGVTPEEISEVVSGVPAEWGITAAERAALVEFLRRRRESLIAHYAPPKP